MTHTVLAFERVGKRYGYGRRERRVFEDASLEIEQGEFAAVCGGRRAGKTTLLRLATGIELADSGVVRLGDHDLARLSATERARLRRRHVGFVPGLYSVGGIVAANGRCETVIDHVAVPLVSDGCDPDAATFSAGRALDRLGATARMDDALHELKPIDYLRVALARAMVRKPKLLLVDDPMTTTDRDERDAIATLLRVLQREERLTLVVASEQPDAIEGAHHILSVGDGRVCSTKEPARVLPFPGGLQDARQGPAAP